MIVDPANGLTIASANALLKAVEEPPPRTVFFLVSHGASTVMPTIRSRCVKLAFRPLDLIGFPKRRCRGLRCGRHGRAGRPATGKLHALSAGSPGRAAEFIAGGLCPRRRSWNGSRGCPGSTTRSCTSSSSRRAGARNAETFARLCDLIEERIEESAKRKRPATAGPGGCGGLG